MNENAKGKDTRWKKGQSGNPTGRPKCGFSYVKELGSQLSQIDPNDPERRTNGQIIVAKQIELAKMGSVRAVGEILDRLLGKPPQAVALEATLNTLTKEERVSRILELAQALSKATSEDHARPGSDRIM